MQEIMLKSRKSILFLDYSAMFSSNCENYIEKLEEFINIAAYFYNLIW